MARSKTRKRVKYYSSRRRKIYAQGDYIDSLVLFELYGWTCCICARKIDKRLRCPNYWAATIDHVIPLSKGGTHTWDNVRPAHWKCNMDKGNSCEDAFRPILIE